MTDNPSQVKARFAAEGTTIAEWSRRHGFNVVMVYRVLTGRVQGKWGEAHRIAVALGLKKEPKARRFSGPDAA